MKKAGIVRVQTSILRRQDTVVQFIATRLILGLCEKATRQPGAQVAQVAWRWWEQTGIDWKGAQERAETATAAAEAAEPGPKTFTDSESETDNTMGGTAGGTGEEASLVASGSSGAGRRTTNNLNFIEQDKTAGTEVLTLKLKRDRV